MGRLHDLESRNESDDERSSQSQSLRSLIIWCALSYCCMLMLFIGVCFPDLSPVRLGLLPLFVHGSSPGLFFAFSQSSRRFTKPKGIEIVALVPFHQSQQTEILDCYLQRNLASNNGFLDKAVFLPQTNDTESLEWLTEIVQRTSSYSISYPHEFPTNAIHSSENVLFVWIDGDVVFLEDHTIPTIVKTQLDHPHSTIVSANVINQAVLESLHSHPSVALPYLPELLHPMRSSVGQDTWRTSALPRWTGPKNFRVHKGFSPPLKTHRWLLSHDEDFDRTPIGTAMYSDEGPGWDDWTVKAQQHYSFLHHLETGDLHRYKFPMWKNPTEPISQNLFCFRGSDAAVVESFVQGNDSRGRAPDQITEASSEIEGIIIDGKGLAAHYSSGHGFEGLDDTDVLQRYRGYAAEMVCPKTA